ncbi:MAG: hypothetical protein AAF487_08295 [Bacteroidota bacterium]
MKVSLSHALFFSISILLLSCSSDASLIEKAEVYKEEKQKGAHIFGHDDTLNVAFCAKNNFDWITLTDWAYQKTIHSGSIVNYSADSSRIEESNAAWLARVNWMQSEGFDIFIKPHLWIYKTENNQWRSEIFPKDEEAWQIWKEDYRKYILRYAKIAEESGAEMFCIGTELTRLTLEKPDYWKKLIEEVRDIYSGKLTYAANWYREFEEITFWDQLDYIGVQAYFPLADKNNPSIEDLENAWEQYTPTLGHLSDSLNKKVIFTELGYRSVSHTASMPWEWVEEREDDSVFSDEAQANCYQAFFTQVWPQDWFAGVHIWQVKQMHLNKGENLDFYLDGKKAEQIVSKAFE